MHILDFRLGIEQYGMDKMQFVGELIADSLSTLHCGFLTRPFQYYIAQTLIPEL